MKPNRSTCFLSQEEFDRIRAKYAKFNEPWDSAEENELREMAADSQPINTMAEQLQRTPNSIRMKLKALGILKPRPTVWTEEDDASLKVAYETGETFEDLARRFGRSEKAIISRLVFLRAHLFDRSGPAEDHPELPEDHVPPVEDYPETTADSSTTVVERE